MSTNKGMLVTFAGVDGSGKGSTIELIKPNFPDAVFVRQPGSSPLAEAVRDLAFKTLGTHTMAPAVWELLVKACILQTEAETIKPALQAGKLVIADRGPACSVAYMRAAHEKYSLPKLVVDLVEGIEHPQADVTFFFTADDVEAMWRRAQGRQGDEGRKQEAKSWNSIEHQRRVDFHYREYFKGIAGYMYQLDAFRKPQELASWVTRTIQAELAEL